MNKQQKIIACHGFLTVDSIAKVVDTKKNYVLRTWKMCGMPIYEKVKHDRAKKSTIHFAVNGMTICGFGNKRDFNQDMATKNWDKVTCMRCQKSINHAILH